jgi:hypothetical protein
MNIQAMNIRIHLKNWQLTTFDPYLIAAEKHQVSN